MLKLAYCDFIADRIKKALKREIGAPFSHISQVGAIQSDLDPEGGWFVSPKKTIIVHDTNGKAYSVTVEEQPFLDIEFEDVDQKVVDNEFE
jgi:hypothetical protein